MCEVSSIKHSTSLTFFRTNLRGHTTCLHRPAISIEGSLDHLSCLHLQSQKNWVSVANHERSGDDGGCSVVGDFDEPRPVAA